MASIRKPTYLRRLGRQIVALCRAFGIGRFLAVVLLSLFVLIRLWDQVFGLTPVEILRVKIFDLYQQIEPREVTQTQVVVVDVDEDSLAELGQWPWPRTILAKLLQQMEHFGVVAVGFDVVFAEADRTSPGRYADQLPDIDSDLLDQLRAMPDNDKVFAEAIAGSRVVLGQSGTWRKLDRYDSEARTVPVAKIGGDPTPYLHSFPGVVRNIPALETAAQGVAMFNLVPENDGLVRRVPLMMLVEGEILPTLSLELLRVATGQQAYAIKSDEVGITSVVVAGVQIPTDARGRVWVRYSKADTADSVSARDVLNGTADPESLMGKLVLIGTSAEGLFDIKSTPVHPSLAGVKVHQQILETILTESYLKRPTDLVAWEFTMLLGVGLLMIAIVPVLGAVFAMLLGAGVAAGLAAASWYLFASQGQLLDVSFTLVAGLSIYTMLVFVNYFREESRRRQVRGAFSQYLSPALVDQLARDPDRLVLGGETKVMTFLFSDVRGFTSISEAYKNDPQGLTRLMNGFLTPLTKAVLATNGTIDKYMGDAIMAFWNAPLDDEAHASRACEAALAMQVELLAVNRRFGEEAAAKGLPFSPLRAGIGINTGTCVVGNMGSDQRFDYSVLGDSVNLASRLEGQSKNYGVDVVLGSRTVAVLDGRFALLELDLITVKGKSEPERIFALMGDKTTAADESFQKLNDLNDAMLAAYRGQDWDRAEALLTRMRAVPTQRDLRHLWALHLSRVRAFRADPPGPDWNGVFVAQAK